ncbi:MAG: DUF692 domain-containing protein [Neomegalonema sp.]|nr:DUF692 domain-containing protein [Neomegalonema sp.]
MPAQQIFDSPADAPQRAGVGFKPQHFHAAMEAPGGVAWFEVHAENYMGAGGAPHRMLAALRERFPLSIHGVGLSIGAEKGLDPDHLARLKSVVEQYGPSLFSEHLAWSSHDVGYLNDLLPLPYSTETLQRVCAHIDLVQQTVGRQMLLENPSSYLRFEHSTLRETDFLKEVAQRTGCGLLLDVNNVFVSATNLQMSAEAYIDAFPLEAVGEIHLGGHATDADDDGAPLLIDAHDREVADPVWALYQYVIDRIGPKPTLIEWDNDVPDWPILAAEAERANEVLIAAETSEAGRGRAA